MAGSSLDSVMKSFNSRISELQELVVARNMYPGSSVAELSALDASLTALELQLQRIKDRLHDDTLAIPKVKKLIESTLRQQKKLQSMSLHVPSHLFQRPNMVNLDASRSLLSEASNQQPVSSTFKVKEESTALPKPQEKKGRTSPPLWYITADELDSLSSYMRGRLTLEKVNAAINDMATYAEANAQLIAAPKKKLAENLWEKALELRDIAMTEAAKGKQFFLETDVKGPNLRLDNTGKAILTVLRHLGRIGETRIGHHRVIILLKSH